MQELMEKIAAEIVKRRLSTIAILILESGKPFSFLGSQMLVFFNPIIKLFINFKDYDKIIKFLEKRENVEKLIRIIEDLEDLRKSEKK